MSVNKKNKPLYKKILKLRYPVNNLNKLNRLKKSKWSNFVLQSKRAVRRRKTFILQDHLIYFNSKYLARYNRKFKINLSLKQKFNVYYGHLLEKYLKSVVRLSLKKNSQNFSYKPSSFMVEILEQRLDVILIRSFFCFLYS
jgi:ribosomal protein S4